MKDTKKLIFLFTAIVLLGFCAVSMGANIKYVFAGIIYGNQGENKGNIIYSRLSGFYDDEFELRLYAPTEEIYYTLDGTDPDKNSIRYDEPILIKDASKNANVYSMRTDLTARFQEEEVERYCDEKRKELQYQNPTYLIDKCSVVKAVYYDKDDKKSEIEERVFFVDFEQKPGYENVNIISISTDPKNLFGAEKGIYVLGDSWQEFWNNGMPEDYWAKKNWNHWSANYHNRGIEWERESSIEVFDTEKNLVLSQNTGIRIQGGGSRGFLPKSLNIYARDDYGTNKLYYDFFGTNYYPKRVTLTSGGDDYYTKIKDRLVSELAEDTHIVTMNYEPYILFLNGEYWGFYYLTEKYDAQFIEHRYDVDRGALKDNIIIIKNGLIETGAEEDWALYSEMLDFILNNDMENDVNYQRACELIDIESFIDYYAVEGYIGRCGDWPSGNFALWRSRNIGMKPYEDGKWRWMLFDVNSTAIEKSLINLDLIASIRAEKELFDSLCNNETFRRDFAKRLIELSDTIFEKNYVNQKITEYVELMELPIENHYQRFFGTTNKKFYEGIKEIRDFFNERRPYIIKSIEDNFGEDYLGENK